MTLSIIVSSAVMLNIVMLSVAFLNCYAECCSVECRGARNVRLSSQVTPKTNGLAYFSVASLTKEKKFLNIKIVTILAPQPIIF